MYAADKCQQTKKEMETHVEKIKEETEATLECNHYQKYGFRVPPNIKGTKGFWNRKFLNLLSYSENLGMPSLFLTLTQNDNWGELQRCIRDGYCQKKQGEVQYLFNLQEQKKVGMTRPAIKHGVEAVVAFERRFHLFKKTFLKKGKLGPLGEVSDFWWRREYQGRGAVHVHMVIWIKKGTMPANLISAEMPRLEKSADLASDKDLRNILMVRDLVKNFQLHNCVPERCRYSDMKRKYYDTCRYGYPYKYYAQDQLR